MSQWQRQLLDGASELFTRGKKTEKKSEGQAKEAELFQQLGRQQMELEWLETSLSSSDTRKLLKPSIATTQNSASAGTMCFFACLAPRSNSSRNRCGNRRRGSWPGSMLSSCMASVVDQVWATEITYIPLEKGFLYLVAIVDLFTRNVLSWKLTSSFNTEFCLEALEMALGSGSKPGILLSDQGFQFTSYDVVARLQTEETRSAGLTGNAATTTSWLNDCGDNSPLSANRRQGTTFNCFPTRWVMNHVGFN